MSAALTARTESGDVHAPGDIAEQTRQVMRGLARLMESAGGSLDDIISMTVYLRDIERDYKAMHGVRLETFGDSMPCTATLEISRMFDDRSLIEVQVLAVVDGPNTTDT